MFDKYNFAVLVKNLVTFIWDVYCNEYLELTHSLFSSKEYDLSILICNKINGTSDIYIGDSNMTYSGTMCK